MPEQWWKKDLYVKALQQHLLFREEDISSLEHRLWEIFQACGYLDI